MIKKNILKKTMHSLSSVLLGIALCSSSITSVYGSEDILDHQPIYYSGSSEDSNSNRFQFAELTKEEKMIFITGTSRPTLSEIQKSLPQKLKAVSDQNDALMIPVKWICKEGYNEEAGYEYHFKAESDSKEYVQLDNTPDMIFTVILDTGNV